MQEAIAQFERDGVVVLRDVLQPEHLAPLREYVTARMQTAGQTETGYDLQAVARQVFDKRDKIEAGEASRFELDGLVGLITQDPEAKPLIEDGADKLEGGAFFYEAGCWRSSDAIQNLALKGGLPVIMAQLIGAETLRFFEDTIFARGPKTPCRTAWHQDLDYFKVGLEGRKIIVWIPLDPCTHETGGTQYIRGSHKWGKTYASNVFFADTPISGSDQPRMPKLMGMKAIMTLSLLK